MRKNYPLLCSLLLAATSAGTAWATPFDYIQDFDNPDDYASGQTLPEGWTSNGSQPFRRLAASQCGQTASSGEYALIAPPSTAYGRDETFATQSFKLRGGKKCTIKFSYLAPGGTPSSVRYNVLHVAAGSSQDYASMTEIGKTKQGASQWTEYEFTFTPSEDGEYYFGFKLEAPLGQSGYVFVDDLEVSGDTPEGGTVDPDKPTAELPYAQSFDNKDGDYDGTSYLPKGWASVGTVPFVTASFKDLPAADGSYYMLTGESSEKRDESAFTPYFNLKAGTTYNLTFTLYMPGNLEGSDPRYTTLSVTAGKDQKREAQDNELLIVMHTDAKGWVPQSCSFTPSEDGLYCFAFNLFSDYAQCGSVAIDNLLITAPGLVERPTASFAYEGLTNLLDSHLLCFHGNDAVQMINTSLYGDTYQWEAKGAEPESSTEENPTFRFPNDGEYTVKLTATNATGSRTTSRTLKISHFTGSQYLALFDYMIGDKVANGYADVPTFQTDETYDFISGPNHYYRRYAERVNLPSDMQLKITSVNSWLTSYNIAMWQTAEERNWPCRLVFYGETNGLPDESKVFGVVNSTVKDMYGQTGIGLENAKGWSYSLEDSPIYVAGPFYVSFEFDDAMSLEPPYKGGVRTFLGLSTVKHVSGRTTLYAKPDDVPTGSQAKAGQWCRADEVGSVAAGYGLNLTLWGTLNDGTVTSITTAQATDSPLALTVSGDALTVTGAQPGECLTVYDLTGRALVSATASATGVTTLSLSNLPHATYVVAGASGQRKFVK